MSLATLFEAFGYPVANRPQEATLARPLSPKLKGGDPLIKVKVKWRRGRFDFEEPYWRSLVSSANNAETMRLRGSKVSCNPLGLTLSRGVPDSCTVRECAANHLRVDLPGSEQATTPCGRGEPCKGELLR